mgnify:CR=1 FL=1|jgi:hypothetical protein
MTRTKELIKQQDWICQDGGRDWRDGLLLGNGNLAAIAYAPGHLEWVVNKVDVFDPRTEKKMLDKIIPHDDFLNRIRTMNPKNTLFLNELEDVPYERTCQRDTISAAVVRLSFWHGIGWSAPPMPRTTRHLSLYEAILEEHIESHGLRMKLRMFIPRNREVICMRLTESSSIMHPHILEIVRPPDHRLTPPVWHAIDGNTIAFTQKLPGGRYSYTVAATFATHSTKHLPTHRVKSSSATLEQYGDTDLFLTVKTSFHSKNTLEDALHELEEAKKTTFDKLEKEHLKWWREYWDKKAYADFGQYRDIQKYYTFSLYEIACVFGCAPMPGLNGMGYGPLNEQVPGVGSQGYTHDQNAQIPALAFMPSNRVELIKALADTYLAAAKTLKKHTRRLFGCDGIFLPLATNQLGMEYPTRAYRYSLCGSAYTGMVLSFAWRYSKDMTLLKEKIYPLLREFTIFYSHIMRRGKDGLFHLDWSVTPEIFTLTRDELATTSMFRVCLETTIETAELLQRDKKLLPRWKEILAHYPAIPKRPDGSFWCGPDVPLNHYFFGGHILYPFFPAGITDDLQAARKTLEFIESDAVERSFADRKGEFHMNHDWSAFLTTAAHLRAGNYAKGWKGVQRFLELFAKENGLFSHDPILIWDIKETEANERANASKYRTGRISYTGEELSLFDPNVPYVPCVTENPDAKRLAPAVLEGNSAFLFLASETLLQSHSGKIRLFPGVPDDFTGSFVSFLAEGGFEVSSAMKQGCIQSVRIKSLHGGKFRLANKGDLEIELAKNEVFECNEGLERL